jgi:hypothetical protein
MCAMTATRDRSDRSELSILSEDVLIAIPRGDDELRLTFTRARIPDGREVAWHSLRVFYQKPDGQWRPGKQGVTIRARELGAIAQALNAAASGGKQAQNSPKPSRDSEEEVPF